LLLLVRSHRTFKPFAESPALHRMAKDSDRASLTLALHRAIVGGVELTVAVTTAAQMLDLIVGKMLDHFEHARILAEELFTYVLAGSVRETLELAIHRRVQMPTQNSFVVLGQDFVPLRGPNHLDHIPACAAENAFKLLNDLAVTAHRSIETLQVAVHDEGQVVETFTRRNADLPQ